jgi:hypothetical protein
LRAGAGDLRLLQLLHLGNAARPATSPALVKIHLAQFGSARNAQPATMRPPWELLRRKWFEASNKPRTIALIGTMIKDFDNMIAKLDKQIAAEGCTRIRDAENPAYSTLAKVTAKRRENLLVSAAQMKSILDVIGR